MTNIKIEKELKLKSGITYQKHSEFTIKPTDDDRVCLISRGDISHKVRYISIFKVPSISQLEHWCFDAVAETPLGNETEADGTDEFGIPSWPRIIGVI